MDTVNVEELSRDQLEHIVVQQSKMLQLQQLKITSLEEALVKSEEEYDELSNVVLNARRVLSC